METQFATPARGKDPSGLMSTIATIKDILHLTRRSTLDDEEDADNISNIPSGFREELASVQQQRYQDKLEWERRLQTQVDLVADLQVQLEEAKSESRREMVLRQSLEEANATLDGHKRALESMIGGSTSSDRSLDNAGGTSPTPENLLRQCREWQDRCMIAEQDIIEWKAKAEARKTHLEESENRQAEATELHGAQVSEIRGRLQQVESGKAKEAECVQKELQELKQLHQKSIQEHGSQVASLKAQLEHVQAVLEKTKGDVQIQLQGKAQIEEAHAAELETVREELKQSLEDCAKQTSISEAQILDLRKKLEEQSQQSQETRAQLESKCQAHTTELQTLREKLGQIEEERANVESESNILQELQEQLRQSELARAELELNTETQRDWQEEDWKDARSQLEMKNAALEVKYKKDLDAVIEEKAIAVEELQQAEKDLTATKDKLIKVERELECILRHTSPEDLEKEKEAEAANKKKMGSLVGSFEKMYEQSEALNAELETLEAPEGPKVSEAEKSKKKELAVLRTAKIGAVLETVESQLQEKLKRAQHKADQMSFELASVRERWRQTKEDVTEAQAELDMCRTSLKDIESRMSDLDDTKKRGAVAGGDDPKRQRTT